MPRVSAVPVPGIPIPAVAVPAVSTVPTVPTIPAVSAVPVLVSGAKGCRGSGVPGSAALYGGSGKVSGFAGAGLAVCVVLSIVGACERGMCRGMCCHTRITNNWTKPND